MSKDPRMEVLSVEPFNAQPPLQRLVDEAVTPTDLFYVCAHGAIPRLDEETYRLSIGGMVARPLRLRLRDLADNFSVVETVATLQCSGNRRDELDRIRPTAGETRWGASAIGTAVWRGTPLAEVVEAVGPLDGAAHVCFSGLDQISREGSTFGFGGSIPLGRALRRDALLAWEMNGQPLPAEHGYPLRVVVPGWIGARSVKWLHEIRLQPSPSDNWYQQRANKVFAPHVTAEAADWETGLMLGETSLTSVICDPADGQELRPGPVQLRGYAMAGGERTVERVEVSADHGANWTVATLGDTTPGAWRLWHAELTLREGAHELLCRAWDSAALTQPEDPTHLWNVRGYMNNAWHRVRVWVG